MAKAIKAHNFNIRSAITMLIIIFSIIITQILLSVTVASGAYEIADLKQTNKDLGQQVQSLRQQTAYMDSPQFLSTKAENLGMVMSDSPAFLRLSDGAVIGVPKAASADNTLNNIEGLIPNALEKRYPQQKTVTEKVEPVFSENVNEIPNSNEPIRIAEGQLIPAPQTR